jgi:LPXTG-motif cell wall-anchored protein
MPIVGVRKSVQPGTLVQKVVEPIHRRERNKKILIIGGIAAVALGGLYIIIKRKKK